ncbi:dual specificity protein phosphatase family protein [Paenibacillus sp. TRM 82003]|nr:dual specificity protein phosphatase family protein [Paenibacillus sp. TRM 82003]
MERKYHALVEGRIFMGGADDVPDIVQNEGIDIVVDLREESTACAAPNANVEWIQVPIGDEAEMPQEQLFRQAIDLVVDAYRSGKKVAFHCGGGKGRTGAVAVGTLLSLDLAASLEEAEEKAKAIRPVIRLRDPQRDALKKLY